MDENTVASALTLKDDHGIDDFTCAQLWINIANNCHSIVLNDYLRRGYDRIAKRVPEPRLRMMLILNHITKVVGKSEYLAFLPNPPWASKLPNDDAPIVLLAVQSGAILVTSDSRLIQKIQSLPEIKSLSVLRPKEAVQLSLDS